MTSRVTVLMTGGTISQRSNERGVAVMNFDPAELAMRIGLPDVDVEFRRVLHKGSKDIVPDDWKVIATAAADALRGEPRGLVVLHGTDTMHYTAAALSFMLQGLSVPIILTGSMIPGADPGSDSLPNLRDAIRVAAHSDIAEVCIVFSADRERTKGVILRGSRARKTHSFAIDAFESINAPPIGYVLSDAIVRTETPVVERRRRSLALRTDLEPNVVLVKLNPATTPGMLARTLRGASGAVLEGTGIGHMKTDLEEVVATFGKPVAMTTQAFHGGERLGLYEGDKQILAIPNVIPTGDMTSETCLVKLMWAMRQGDVRSTMQANIAGEISLRGSA